jgi:hypothetical protein
MTQHDLQEDDVMTATRDRIEKGDDSASLIGETFSRMPIGGSDSIRPVGCK